MPLLIRRNARMVLMLSQADSSPSSISDTREARVQALLARLQPEADQILRRMAESLVDLPEDRSFGQIEYTLRDLAHELAASCHQTGLEAGEKKGITGPASSAPTAGPTPGSSTTGAKPG
jgi:hypothetical protein